VAQSGEETIVSRALFSTGGACKKKPNFVVHPTQWGKSTGDRVSSKANIYKGLLSVLLTLLDETVQLSWGHKGKGVSITRGEKTFPFQSNNRGNPNRDCTNGVCVREKRYKTLARGELKHAEETFTVLRMSYGNQG